MHMHQQNHWNRVLFYWYQSYHWYQWTISLTNRIRLCICFAWLAYRTRNIHKNYGAFLLWCNSELVLRGWLIGCNSELVFHGWLIERGVFIIIISAFLLGVKANLFCMVVL